MGGLGENGLEDGWDAMGGDGWEDGWAGWHAVGRGWDGRRDGTMEDLLGRRMGEWVAGRMGGWENGSWEDGWVGRGRTSWSGSSSSLATDSTIGRFAI